MSRWIGFLPFGATEPDRETEQAAQCKVVVPQIVV